VKLKNMYENSGQVGAIVLLAVHLKCQCYIALFMRLKCNFVVPETPETVIS
jgi:hypothetical protein